MVIDEEKIRRIVKEELGIARKVINIVNQIENKIMELYNRGTYDSTFYIDDLKVVFKHIFTDNYDFVSLEDFKNGYDYETNTIYLTNSSKKGESIDLSPLIDTIQHEVEHYWQCKKSNKCFITKKYQAITNGLYRSNRALFYLCKLFYLNNKFELDSYVNGAFNVLRKLNCNTYKEFIENTELKDLFSSFSDLKTMLLDNNFYKTNEFVFAKEYILKNKIFKKELNRDNLLKVLKNIEDYVYKKIGKAWIYYVEEGIKDFTNEEIKKMSSFERKLYFASKHSEKMKLEGRENGLLY